MPGNPVQEPRAATDTGPLCVMLDDALLPGDVRLQALLSSVKARPRLLLRVPSWFSAHRRALRSQVGPAQPQVEHFPWNRNLLATLTEAKAAGRPLILVTKQPDAFSAAVAEHLGIFDAVVGADTAGEASVKDALADRYGDLPFDIIGAPAAGARKVLPSPPARPRPGLRVILRATRAHQWLKNTLIFLPVLAGQRLTDGATLGRAGLAFVAFSLVASSVYVLNDLLDLEDDRRHPTKRLRPFASGALPLSASPVMLFAMLGTALTISLALLPAAFTWTLAAYFALSFAYSLKLKGAVLIDVFTLAALYTLRVIAGSAATGIEPSVWLLGFCMFFFLSLALVKRYAELHSMRNDFTSVSRIPGRSYEPGDLPVLVALGVGTGCLSVLVLALYVISDEFAAHYTYPFLIWQLCPLALYWIGRAWMVVARDEMHDDPLIWAVRDQLSRWVVIAAFLILIFAR